MSPSNKKDQYSQQNRRVLPGAHQEERKKKNILIASAHRYILLIYYAAKYLSLYAPITSDECPAWFHLNVASPAARNAKQGKITN